MARTPTPAGAGTGAATLTTPPIAITPPASTTSDDTATENSEAANNEPTVEVRVLIAFDDYVPNDVAEIPETELQGRLDAGEVDDHADAVAYARDLAQ